MRPTHKNSPIGARSRSRLLDPPVLPYKVKDTRFPIQKNGLFKGEYPKAYLDLVQPQERVC